MGDGESADGVRAVEGELGCAGLYECSLRCLAMGEMRQELDCANWICRCLSGSRVWLLCFWRTLAGVAERRIFV